MRTLVLLAGLALALGALVPASASPAAGGSDRPFKAYGAGTGTTDLLTGQGHLVTTGPASHFGWATFEQHYQLVPTGPGTFNGVIVWTLTAANGDEMFGTGTSTGRFTDPIHSTTSAHYVATGGTGRFSDVSGTFTAAVQGTRVSLEGQVATTFFEGTVVGRLSY